MAPDPVEEGIELLSGVPAGVLNEDGEWSEGSVLGRCQRRLMDMARLMRNAGKDEAKNGNGENNGESPPEEEPGPASS